MPNRVNDTVPENLPEQNRRVGYVVEGEVVECGFVEPHPANIDYLKKNNSYTDAQFLVHIKPLNIKFDTDPTFYEYETNFGNDLAVWLDYRSGNGDIKGPNSFYGVVKAAFAALGHNLLTNEDCDELIGKRFKFFYGPPEIEGLETKKWIPIPEAELTEDYVAPATPKVIFRPKQFGEGKTPSVALTDEIMNKLADTLNGATTKDFIRLLAQAKLPKDANAVLVNEASNGAKLVKRMVDSGKMKSTDGKLVKV